MSRSFAETVERVAQEEPEEPDSLAHLADRVVRASVAPQVVMAATAREAATPALAVEAQADCRLEF
jgi:hypothetical protein